MKNQQNKKSAFDIKALVAKLLYQLKAHKTIIFYVLNFLIISALFIEVMILCCINYIQRYQILELTEKLGG